MSLATSSAIKKLTDSLEQYDDVTSWINDELSTEETIDELGAPGSADLTKLDQHITQLLTTLDIACEDTSAQLERIIDDVSRAVPRLAYDLHFMKDGALSLQSSLVDVLKQSRAAIPAETSAALDNLHQLDMIKGHMEAAREVLQEAESWSTLEMEVTSLIAERSYAKAAERLSEASKSMVVFQNTPEYDPRRSLMVNLQNQLEASLSSALVAAINAQEVATCKEYFSIFSTIQRESEFRNYYNAARRTTIVSMWQSTNLADCDDNGNKPDASGPQQTFAEFLPKFYSSFLALLNAERKSISSIFPDPPQTLAHFLSSTMSTLQPTFSQRLSSYANHYGEECLPHLGLILKATEEFATGVWKLMDKLEGSEPARLKSSNAPSERSLHRRRSSRLSISWRPGQRPTSLMLGGGARSLENMEWDQELFQPFLDMQVQYSSLERRFLDQSLLDIISSDTRETSRDSDLARLFRERAVDIVGAAEGSMGRCKSFTHGYGSVGLVQALDGFFASFVDSWAAELGSQPSGSPNAVVSSAEIELGDLDYSAKDWSEIQLMLHMLGSMRGVSERITTFETKLRSFLSQIASHFRLAQADPQNITIAATKGESQLLEQSTLNSAELFLLLGSVDDGAHRDTPLTAPLSSTFRPTPSQPAPSEHLLVQTRNSLSNFAMTCQTAMQKTILSPLRQHLSSYPYLAIWASAEDPQSALAADLNIPTFSLSPSEAIQRVAEGLLNLPQLFEVYADDDALGYSIHTLPHIGPEMLKLTEQLAVEAAGAHNRRGSVSLPRSPILDPEMISSAWLVSLGHTFIAYLTDDVLTAISTLTSAGAAQLSSDLEYLTNIVRALNVENDALEKWKNAVHAEEKDVKRGLQESGVDSILLRVGKLRGWC